MGSTLLKNLLRLAALALALLCVAATALHACGPCFPNNLLVGGDEALLSAPVADFERELQRLNLAPSRFIHREATHGYEAQTVEAEMADLEAALKRATMSPEESGRILEAHRVNRKRLSEYLDACSTWDSKAGDESAPDKRRPQPAFPAFEEVPGLPGEFADYFAGAAALHNPGAGDSFREAWERLLARPPAQRKYKSTWAAFMLGKTWEQADDDKAIEYFQMTRDLAKQRFADSIGLAAAAIGREARVELQRQHFHQAIKLYLEQYAAGDGSAVVSLRWAAADALAAGGDELAALAGTPDTRSVITAYLICGERGARFAGSGSPSTNAIGAWLEAVEAAGVKDVESAERLALAAYQEGAFESAQRWVNRARRTPVAQWLQAKLLLRAGKTQPAAALLAKVANSLPLVTDSQTTNPTEFADSLHMSVRSYDRDTESARAQVLGELGALRLSRREFTQALDALLRAGFWMDAAYVAERVLTTDELKDYVDREWRQASSPAVAGGILPPRSGSRISSAPDQSEPLPPGGTPGSAAGEDARRHGENLRYLLARRLTRELRGDIAREYYPREWQPKFDELIVALRGGWDESAPNEQRAKALFTAAIIARNNGMELLGTEVEPDWHIHGGAFTWDVTWECRATNASSAVVNVASSEEVRRAINHHADPEARFHYRYQAAFLAWEATKLMPDHSDETARVLCTAGSWLKRRAPQTADIFYKALVRRCRKTAIGDQADRMRWFPVLDENGNPIPWKKPERAEPQTTGTERAAGDELTPAPQLGEPPSPDPSVTAPAPTASEGIETGFEYRVCSGDSLSSIAAAFRDRGVDVTAAELLHANPALNSDRLKIGEDIFVPAKAMEHREAAPQKND